MPVASENAPRRTARTALTFIQIFAFVLYLMAPMGVTASDYPSGNCAPTGLETVATDQADYDPGETVHVSGSGYAPSCDVVVVVTRPNGSIVVGDGSFQSGSDTVSTDDSGNLTYDYILNGIDGDYTVEVVGAGSDVLAFTTFADSIASDCFRSVATGNWNATTTWETAPAPCTVWTAATLTPTAAANTITIRSPHTVTVTAAAAADQLVVQSGATLSINSGQTLSLNNGSGTDLTVDSGGTVTVNGTLTMGATSSSSVSGDLDITGTGLVNGNGGSGATRPSFTVNSGGDFTTALGGSWATGGSGPAILTFAAGSTADNAGTISGSNDLSLNGTLTASGNISAGGTVPIGPFGNVTMTTGTLTGMTGLTVNGILTAGSNVTLASISNLQVNGTMEMTGGTLTTTRGNAGLVASINNGGSLILAGSSQWQIIGNGNAEGTVLSGGTLEVDPLAIVGGAGDFSLTAGATLVIGSAVGISSSPAVTGNIQNTGGTRTFSAAANYTYDGATQNTGNALPATIANLTIDSSDVVTLSSAGLVQTVTQTLAVTSGTFDQGATINLSATSVTTAAAGTYRNIGTGDITLGVGGVTNAGTIQLDGSGMGCPGADAILVRSSGTPTQRLWSGLGTFSLTDVNVQDQAGSALITVLSGTDNGNNGANWVFVAGCVAVITAMTVDKSSTTSSVSTPGAVTYDYLVTNTGNVVLTGIALVDDNTDAAPVCVATTLAPTATTTCSATHTVTQAEINQNGSPTPGSGNLVNNVAASSTQGASDTDSLSIPITQTITLTVVKSSTTSSISAPGAVTYDYLVTNTGNVVLTGISLSDDNSDAAPVCVATTLAPSASTTCSATHTVTQAEINQNGSPTPGSGNLVNNVAASSTQGASDTDSLSILINQDASLLLDKTTSTPTYDSTSDVLLYSFDLENDGNVTLSGPFTITDDQALDESCPVTASLAPGGSITCTASYPVDQADLDAGSVTNIASGHGFFGLAVIDSNTDSETATADQDASLLLDKTTSTPTYDSTSDVLLYSFDLENDGNVTLSGPFTITDDQALDESCPVTASLAPGGSITCTASYPVDQADLDAGSVTNIASGHGFFGLAVIDSNTDSETATADQDASLLLDKTTSTPTYDSTSDVLLYSFDLENDGNVTLSGPFTITDDQALDESCPVTASLAPGGSITCTASYPVDQADLDAGSVTNIASGHGFFGLAVIDSNTDSETATADQDASLLLDKTTSTPTYDSTSDVLLYSFDLSNDGNVTLSGPFTITDDQALDESCPGTASLAPGGSLTCTASYTITQADLDAGSVTNVASGHGFFGLAVIDSNTDSETATADQDASLLLDKTTSTPTYDSVGDVLLYSFDLSNDGNVTLTGPFTITDDQALDESCPGTASLAPGGSLTCTASYTITQADLDAGSVTNVASGHGFFGLAVIDSNTDSETATADQDASLLLDKTTSTPTYDSVGDVLLYSFDLSNDGNVTLTGPFTITDDQALDESCPGTASLAPGASLTCTASYTITQADLDAGSVTNVASGHGFFGLAVIDSNTDSETATADQDASLLLDKTTSTPTYDSVGDVLLYSFDLSNDGNVTLTGPFTITDDQALDESCPGTASLAPGASLTCTASYTITQADLDAGSVTNVASGHGFFGLAVIDSNTDSETATADQDASLLLDKTTSTPTYDSVGDVLLYSFDLSNDGNVTLTGPFTITDDQALDESCPGTASLAPGASLTCTASYTITQADLDAGSVTNVASGHGFFGLAVIDSNTDSETATADQDASLLLDKTTSTPTYDSVGDVLLYSFDLSNDGNVTLTGPFTITDDQALDESCPGTASLAPGASLTCTASYTITQADLDAGSVTNVASGHGFFGLAVIDSNTDSETATADQDASLLLDKTTSTPTYDSVGDVLLYSFDLSNDGNVTLTGPFTITDDQALDESCPGTASLAPGASLTCTASYTITQADLDAGSVTNVASGHGFFGLAVIDSNTDSETATADQDASLLLDKTTSTPTYDSVGDVLLYSFDLSNDGNVTLTGPFTITDDQALDESCPGTASLAPGASLTCTASYTITQADLDAGSVTNVASGHGFFGLAVIDSNTDSETATAVFTDADLGITKTGPATATIGDEFDYTITVTNHGPAANAGFTVVDELPVEVSFVSASAGCVEAAETVTCTSAGLANGASVTWTITVSADLMPGAMNTAEIATTVTTDPNAANDIATVTTDFNPDTLLSDVATGDPDWTNHIDGVDVLFQKNGSGSSTTYKLKATNPGTFRYRLSLENETGLDIRVKGHHLPNIIKNGVSLKDRNGASTTVFLTVPTMPSNTGTPIPSLSGMFTEPAFVLDGYKAVKAHPDDRSDELPISVWYIPHTAPAVADCSTASGYIPLPSNANGKIPRCLRIDGLEIPKHHEAHVHVAYEFRWKDTSSWGNQTVDPTLAFRAGFNFKSTTIIELLEMPEDLEDQLDHKLLKLPAAVRPAYKAAYMSLWDNTYSGNHALGLVFAGERVTAVGGFVFDPSANGRPDITVRLFSAPPTSANRCNPTLAYNSGNYIASYVTGSDGFYFIWQKLVDNTGISTGTNTLASGFKYYVALCDFTNPVPGSGTAMPFDKIYWPARSMASTLGNKEFDQEDFFVSGPTSLAFTSQPVSGKKNYSMGTVKVSLIDGFGQVMTLDTGTGASTVTISKGTGSANLGTLSASSGLTKTMNNGVVTWTDLKINAAGLLELYADSSGPSGSVPPRTSLPINITN